MEDFALRKFKLDMNVLLQSGNCCSLPLDEYFRFRSAKENVFVRSKHTSPISYELLAILDDNFARKLTRCDRIGDAMNDKQ